MKNIFLPLLLFVLLTSCNPVVESTMTISSAILILDELQNSIDDTVNSVEFAANKTINNASIQLQTNIHEFKQSILAVSDDLDTKITKQQFDLLDNITNITNEFEKLSNQTSVEINNLINSIGQVSSDLPFTKNEPRITTSSSNIYVLNWSNNLILDFAGFNLDHSKNYIRLNDKIVHPSDQISTKVSFKIPSDTIKNGQLLENGKLNYIQAELVLHYRKNWFSLKKSQKIIPISIRILPRQIGLASLTFQINEWAENIETIVVPDCIVHTRGTGLRGRSRSARISCSYTTPTKLLKSCNKEVKGKIVPGSIRPVVLENRHGGDFSLTSVTDFGFIINTHAKSESKPGGGGGKYHVRTSYKAKYPCKVAKEITIDSIPIVIGSDYASSDFNNSPEPKFKRLNATMFDGTHFMLTQKDDNTNLIEIEYNEPLKQLIIKPIKIDRN